MGTSAEATNAAFALALFTIVAIVAATNAPAAVNVFNRQPTTATHKQSKQSRWNGRRKTHRSNGPTVLPQLLSSCR